MNLRNARPLLVATAVATLGLAGCGNGLEADGAPSRSGVTPSASGTSSASPSASSAPTSEPSAGPSPSPGGTTSTAPASPGGDRTGRCPLGSLDVGVRAPEGGAAAGSSYLLVTFRNTGSRPCVLSGFPGVSFVGKGNGTQLGAAAARTGSARTVTLQGGGSTTALLRIADAGAYPERSCAPTTADGLRIYPPGSTEAAYVARSVEACQGSTGGSPQLTVASVGTSG